MRRSDQVYIPLLFFRRVTFPPEFLHHVHMKCLWHLQLLRLKLLWEMIRESATATSRWETETLFWNVPLSDFLLVLHEQDLKPSSIPQYTDILLYTACMLYATLKPVFNLVSSLRWDWHRTLMLELVGRPRQSPIAGVHFSRRRFSCKTSHHLFFFPLY